MLSAQELATIHYRGLDTLKCSIIAEIIPLGMPPGCGRNLMVVVEIDRNSMSTCGLLPK